MSLFSGWRIRVLVLIALALTVWAAASRPAESPGPHFGLGLGFAGGWAAMLIMTNRPKWRYVAVVVALLLSAAGTLVEPGLNTMLVVSVGWAGAQIPWKRMGSLGVLTVLFACAITVLASGQVGSANVFDILRTAQFFNVVFLYGVVLLLGRFASDSRVARQAQTAALEQLQQAHAELQRLAATAEELAALRERARLSRDLHDTLGHALSAITVQLEAVRRLMPREPGQADVLLRETQETARAAMRDLRVHLAELREPGAPEDLAEALRQMAATAATQHGWQLVADIQDVDVSEHGRDDGCGFDPARVARDHFGLAGMRERLQELGGDLAVESSPGQGTCVTGTLPIAAAATGGA